MMRFLFFFFILQLHTSDCISQLFTVNNTSVSLTGGAQLSVKGDLLNQNSGTISNQGVIDLTGNWINNAGNNCFGTSQGTVILNGNVQTIGGTSTTVFNHLNLLGAGNKTLLVNTETGGGNLTPTGVLSLNDRILILNTHTLTINNSSVNAITRTTGFIESETSPITGYGTIKWLMNGASAGSSYVFPFGTSASGSFIPVSFDITTAGSGSNPNLSISTYPTVTSASPNNRPLPTGLTSLMNAFTGAENAPNVLDRFWVINAVNFTSLPVSTLAFTYRESEWDLSGGSTNTIVESQLKAQFNNGVIWSNPPVLGTVNTSSNIVTVPGMNNYSGIWTLVGNSTPLPVELLYFEAKAADNEKVICNWITATEINNDYFVVERSRNGLRFDDIGKVEGAGNSNQMLSYAFTDHAPFTGVSYYRLKQVDFDGNFSYSNIVAVNIIKQGSFSVFPNPALNTITISFISSSRSDVHLDVISSSGQVVQSLVIESTSGTNQQVLDISNLAAGVYTIRLQNKHEVIYERLIKN
jgi:hypothetical protein